MAPSLIALKAGILAFVVRVRAEIIKFLAANDKTHIGRPWFLNPLWPPGVEGTIVGQIRRPVKKAGRAT
jgi:hypothetical protein